MRHPERSLLLLLCFAAGAAGAAGAEPVAVAKTSGAGEEIPRDTPEGWPEPHEDQMPFASLQVDQLEWRHDGRGSAEDGIAWELQAWFGNDRNRLWFESEGETNTTGRAGGEAELQLFYGRMLSRFFDLRLGVRQDLVFSNRKHRERTLFALGVEGLAPLRFEVEPTLFVSDDGDVSFRFTTTYDLFVTQRLVAQPWIEVNAAFGDVADFEVQSGFNDIEVGLRLRYELRREFAPYLGLNWERALADTADRKRADGENVDVLALVLGLRLMF